MRENRLKKYEEKRDFRKTTEPKKHGNTSYDQPMFVIQKHDSQNLHYDFRLEIDGVLRSWVIPKGPSTDPSEKRLAIETEDHPISYADFEGIIPEGEYGAGEVIIWDKGTYENHSKKNNQELSMQEGHQKGHMTFWLEGEKIKGGYALVRIDDDEKQWLLIKEDDEEADARRNPSKTKPKSVVSGRTLDDLKDENR